MKVARILALAAVATLAVTSMSFAAGSVWFEAQAQTPNATAGTGGPGQDLSLDCDISGGLRCDWLVTVFYNNTDGGAGGWGLDLGTLNPADDGKFTIKSFNIPSNALNAIANPPALNNGSLLAENAGGFNFNPPPAGLFVLATFVLSKNKLPGELNTSSIYVGIGSVEFGGDDADGFDVYEVVQIGSNAPVIGYNPGPWPYNALPNAAITVRNTPEPATLGLLGLGVLALGRRRK